MGTHHRIPGRRPHLKGERSPQQARSTPISLPHTRQAGPRLSPAPGVPPQPVAVSPSAGQGVCSVPSWGWYLEIPAIRRSLELQRLGKKQQPVTADDSSATLARTGDSLAGMPCLLQEQELMQKPPSPPWHLSGFPVLPQAALCPAGNGSSVGTASGNECGRIGDTVPRRPQTAALTWLQPPSTKSCRWVSPSEGEEREHSHGNVDGDRDWSHSSSPSGCPLPGLGGFPAAPGYKSPKSEGGTSAAPARTHDPRAYPDPSGGAQRVLGGTCMSTRWGQGTIPSPVPMAWARLGL